MKTQNGNSSFRVAFDQIVSRAKEIKATFIQRGHQNHMTHLERQLFDRVVEFIGASESDQCQQACDGCGRGTAMIGEACDHCGEVIECAVR